MWQSAQGELPPSPWEARRHCRNCPIGAERAGTTVPLAAAAVDDMRQRCARCGRNASRLIHKTHCVSCYNRQREARLGRNAKGTRPHLCDVLHPQRLAIATASTIRVVALAAVTGREEAVAMVARYARDGLAVGVPLLTMPPLYQCELPI